MGLGWELDRSPENGVQTGLRGNGIEMSIIRMPIYSVAGAFIYREKKGNYQCDKETEYATEVRRARTN